MTRFLPNAGLRLALAMAVFAMLANARAQADLPNPVLHTVFPPGGQAGTSLTVALEGIALDGLRELRVPVEGLTAKKLDGNRLRVTIPGGARPGVYDLRGVGLHGLSSPRAFFISDRAELVEKEPNDTPTAATESPLDGVVNGRIDKPGDVDYIRFAARAGQRVVVDCWADRVDSQLRAVLEIYNAGGKRLAANRGYTGIDPLLDFLVPADGAYFIKVFDLSFLGSSAHFYRLDIDTKPRVEFALPCVVQRGQNARVKLYGRNLLPPASRNGRDRLDLDCVEIDVTAPGQGRHECIPLPLRPAQVALDAFPYYYPGSHAPVLIGVTDVPVVTAAPGKASAGQAQGIAVPCEISGMLADGDERHEFTVNVRRGEVLWLEAFGERLGAPVDLELAVLDPSGRRELLKLSDNLDNLGGYRFPTTHTDPAGRWVAPADGHYRLVVRNVIGGLNRDPRRVYRVSVRREEPDFHLAVVSRRTDEPAALNVCLGGREWVEVMALRHRGLSVPIRVSAENLPSGVHCTPTWIGPGQEHAPLVLTADRDCATFAGSVEIVGHADLGGAEITRRACGGTMIWPGRTTPSGRLTQEIPLAVVAEAKPLLTAMPADAVIDQDSALDIAVSVESRSGGAAAPIRLTAVGLPVRAGNATAAIPPGQSKAWLSFFFPASLPTGPYTFAIQGETEVMTPKGKTTVTLVTNPITVQVRPARIVLEVDGSTPRKIGRGKIIQLRFTARRQQGFRGKIHTELVAPGGVVGLRGRGVTLVGQSDSGTLQVIATENAPLGRQLFLRLEAVGTVEDQPVFRASRMVELEITE